MNQEEKDLLVVRQVEKAHHFLNQADEMMTLGHTDLAVNRLYYSCFHIVQALFLKSGISVRTHSGIITQFSQHFVKTDIVSMEKGSLLARLFQLRQKADYNCAYDISVDEAKSLVEPVHLFVAEITELINQKN
ncbi:MAG: HEPN domain-containing protein [Bacteroidales bacterium]|nr:HEPN domain-containing protein [Bacteroidales bacterium]